MKTALLFVFIVVGFINGFSQNIHFLKSYGNSGYDYGRDIKQTVDTGYIATGSSSSFGSADADVFLLKIDSLGNFKWSWNYGGTGSDWGQSLVITYDSSYAVGGYTNSFGAGGFDFYLVRAAIDGTPLWEKTYGGSDWDQAYGLAEIPSDSGFVLVGETFSYGAGSKDIYIVRTDKNGDTLWTKTYGGPENDFAKSVLVDGDSIVVCGGTESFGAGMSDGIILKMDLDGNIGWEKIIGQDSLDYFTSVINGGSFYLLGGTRSYNYSNDYNDFWVYKITHQGNEIVDTSWGGDQIGYDIVNDVALDQTNNIIYYGGSTTSWGTSDVTLGVTDCFISKLDGGYGWMPYVQNFGDLGSDVLFAMEFCYDEGLIAIGDLNKYSSGGNNVLIVKIDKDNTFNYITIYEDVTYENITLSVEENLVETKNIVVYPNPTDDFITISVETDFIEIYNNQGQLIKSIIPESNLIDLRSFESGVFVLKLYFNDTFETVRIFKL